MPIGEKRIVTITGGSGGAVLLEGLRARPGRIAAVCNTFDDGGSTGRIIREFDKALPPGDLRRCLWALAESGVLRDILNLELEGQGDALSKHRVGNILLLALQQLFDDPVRAVHELGEMLKVKGRVLPVSIDSAELVAKLSDGTCLRGESAIGMRPVEDIRTIEGVRLEPEAHTHRDVYRALINADVVVIGPGDLYTSLIPNLLVNGVTQAIQGSEAKIIFVLPLMTRAAETRGYDATKFVEVMWRHLGFKKLKKKIDVVIANEQCIPEGLQVRYWQREQAQPVHIKHCRTEIASMCDKLYETPLLSSVGLDRELVRHDPIRLSGAIMTLI